MEMLTITPLKRLELIAGKAITPLIIGSINFLIMLAIARTVFDVPMRGAFVLLFGMTLFYLLCEIGFGLTLSTLTRTQQQAVTIVFIWIMVALTLSGYMVPISTLPPFLQYASALLPLRHYLTIVRGVMLKGSGLVQLWPHAVAIVGLMVAAITVATRTLNRAIE
jgi:ABC-2 type transport system permease protein